MYPGCTFPGGEVPRDPLERDWVDLSASLDDTDKRKVSLLLAVELWFLSQPVHSLDFNICIG